jgi:hypothetical protein
MRLRFLVIDPETNGDECPAVFVDEETGDLVFQGWTLSEPDAFADGIATCLTQATSDAFALVETYTS